MLYNLFNVTFNWNVPDSIIQIIASILGAFLGFLFAIKVSELDKKKQNNEHIKNLYQELKGFCSEENIAKLKKCVTHVEDIRIINLPVLERTINFNIGFELLGVTIFKKLKDLNLVIEKINYIFSIKNEYYHRNTKLLADIDELKLNLEDDMKLLMTGDSSKDQYIGYLKTIYNEITNLFNSINQDKENIILSEFESNKKIKKLIN